jgi:MFS family permease
VTGLVFGKIFVPDSDPLVGVPEAFAIYTVGFIGRPIGAAIFGHYGDRIGRKGALIATLLITGIATAAVGLVPTYEQIGIWGAVIPTIIRFIQGVGVGGEWGGSVLLSMWSGCAPMRTAASEMRLNTSTATFASSNPAGPPSCGHEVTGDQFLVWGWRIPFLLSIVMIAIGLYIRLGILETPAFGRIVPKTALSELRSSR